MSTKDERTVNETVEANTPMKEWLVNYVGEQHEPGDDQVTVEMIVETMAKEFPEFVLALAEENWIRGYQQAFVDIEAGMKAESEQENANS